MCNKESIDPRNYCIDCSVYLCWRGKGGFIAIGSTINHKPFKCDRPKRLHSWKEVEQYNKKRKSNV